LFICHPTSNPLPAGIALIRHHPFRSPHHTISHAGLVTKEISPSPVKSPLLIAAFYSSIIERSLKKERTSNWCIKGFYHHLYVSQFKGQAI
jgi:hypothetical protein